MSLCEAGYFVGREWVDSPYCGDAERHRDDDRCFVGYPKLLRDMAGQCEDFTDAWKSSNLCRGTT